MTPTRTELAYDILMKLLDQDTQDFPVVNAFLIADEFLEEVKRHEAENEIVFKTVVEKCCHFHTEMFNDHGFAKCFDCGKVVNENREIVEVVFDDHK